MRSRGWALYAVLLAVAIGMSVAAGSRARSNSPVPSVDNAAPSGARALWLYLSETGFDVRAARESLLPISPDVRTVVLASPTARTLTAEEVAGLDEFARRGGTLVVMGRDLDREQPKLGHWIDVAPGPRPSRELLETNPDSVDPSGADAKVFLQRGALAGVQTLRVANEGTLRVLRPAALALAGNDEAVVAWWVPLDRGELFVFAGADILENRRVELAGNLAFWHALAAQGPIVFDEFHHRAGEGTPLSTGVLVIIAQLIACFVVFSIARGARLGPARPVLAVRHRSTLEYLSSFAWLTRRAGVEKELLFELRARFRVLLHERLGVEVSQTEEEAAREVERQCRVPAGEYLRTVEEVRALEAAARVSARQFARAAREYARLERIVTGRAESLRSP